MDQQRGYLLVEGVNIYDNLLDTDQLSVIRGGSFLLKGAIDAIRDEFESKLEPLSTGASSGLFRIIGGQSASSLVSDVVGFLRKHQDYRFLPFIVVSTIADTLLEAKEKLLTQLRFAQLQSPTFAPDVVDGEHRSLGIPCQLEGRRAAVTRAERKVQSDQPRQLSLSVLRRLDHGRAMRQDHYFRKGDKPPDLHGYRFTDDFEALANCEEQGVLSGKLAVIYADGNKFSKIQREYLGNSKKGEQDDAQRQFDKRVQTLRNAFLKDLLLEMVKGDDGRFPDAVTINDQKEPAIRCETLLWGGDEFQFVLPAWMGLEFVQYFFEKSREWRTPDGTPLTHALGIVFCHAKSPIRVIGQLARNLAEEVKEGLGDDPRRNAWDYIVLESIDYPANPGIGDFMSTRYGAVADVRPPFLPPDDDWRDTKERLISLARNGQLTRRQLYRIADAFNAGVRGDGISWRDLTDPEKPLPENPSEQSRLERRMFRLMAEKERKLVADMLNTIATRLMGCGASPLDSAAGRAWLWIHLIEWWDYWPGLREEAEQ